MGSSNALCSCRVRRGRALVTADLPGRVRSGPYWLSREAHGLLQVFALTQLSAIARFCQDESPSVVSQKFCCYSEPHASALDGVGTPCRSYGYAASSRLARAAPPSPR